MTNTEEWLRQVSGEPVEQPTWSDQALDEMAEVIHYHLTMSLRDDPELLPDLVRKTLHVLREHNEPWAAGLVEALWHRAETRVPYSWDEPQEPAWSLDSDRASQDLWPNPAPEHEIRRVHDVVDDL